MAWLSCLLRAGVSPSACWRTISAAKPQPPSDGEAKPERRAGGRRQVDDAFEDLLDTFTAHLDKVRYLAFGSQDTYAYWVRDYYRWLVATEPALLMALTEIDQSCSLKFTS